jgi:pSer/pThr/pTyr-binding forkhead associated (FHA) protein
VPEQLLKFLTYVFLGLLYLFFLRVLRAVWMELREPKAAPPAPVPIAAGPAAYVASSEDDGGRRSKRKAERVRIVEPPDRKGQEFDLGDELTIGRAAGCRVSIPEDTFVSQVHARVFRRDGDLWLEDLGSTNGTQLNDKRVSAPVVIRRGDHIRVGKTLLEVTK